MISRFQGLEGKPRLVAALRSQQIVQDEEPLAIALADAAQLVQVEPASPNSEIIKQGATDNDIHLILSGLVSLRVRVRTKFLNKWRFGVRAKSKPGKS